MSSFNLKRSILQTLLGKGGILLLNFFIVVYSTRTWGAEGKGIVAIFTANLGLVAIVANLLTASSVSFYLSKFGISKLYTQAWIWIFIVSALSAIFFHVTEKYELSLFLFVASIFSGFVTFYTSVFLGKQKIQHYNTVTFLQPLLLLLLMVIINKLWINSYFAYFYAQVLALFLVYCVSVVLARRTVGRSYFDFDKIALKSGLVFGGQTELSNFLQFFNYRLSFYFLNYLAGPASVGVFSIGVTMSESIWIISRSISLVQYSKLIGDGDSEVSIRGTQKMALYSLYASLACIAVVLLIPESIYTFIFGPEFSGVKKIVAMLSPGILAISMSNVYGHYFSAIGHLKILVWKSAIGVCATIILSFAFVRSMQLTGACIVNAGANVVTSVVLFIWFFRRYGKITNQSPSL